MRFITVAACVLYAALPGCDVFRVEAERKPAAPAGILPVGENLQSLSAPPAASPPATPPGPVAPVTAPPAAPSASNKGIIGKTTAEVVNSKEALQNPNIKEVPNEASGGDPLSFALSAYVSIRSKASTLGFQKALNDHKGIEGRPPTFSEFKQMLQQHRIEFTELYPFQMYGYNPDTGNIVVLEDTQKKAEIYQAAGLNPDGT